MKKILNLFFIILITSCTQPTTNYSEIQIQPQYDSQKQKILLNVGETVQIEGKVSLKNGQETKDLLWSSENSNIVTVNNEGYVKAISPGITNITLTSKENSEYKTTLEITVKQNTESDSDSINLNKDDVDYLNRIQQENEKKKQEDLKKIENPAKNYETTSLRINVFDNNNQPVNDVIINAKSLSKDIIWSENISASNGSVNLKNVPNECLIEISVIKDKWNIKKRNIVTKGIPKDEFNPIDINFGGVNDSFYALQYQPEILETKINSLEITGLITQNNNLISSNNYIIVKQPLKTISFSFIKQINKETFEDNLVIRSEPDKEGNVQLYEKNKGLNFVWDRFNKRVDIYTNIAISDKAMFKLFFKNPFIDLAGNQAITGRFISFQNQEIYVDQLNILLEK